MSKYQLRKVVTGTDFYIKAGKSITEHREALGISIGALAEEMGIEVSVMESCEQGKCEWDLRFAYDLCLRFGVTYDVLLKGTLDTA